MTYISRLRLDAALYEFPTPNAPGTRGKQALNGTRAPSLAQRLADPTSRWQRVQLPWYGGRTKTMELLTGTNLWYTASYAPLPLRWVLVRDPQGRMPPSAFFSTTLSDSPHQIVGWFVQRWRVEVTFQECRAHLGVESQRQWSPLAIARTTPILLGLFSLVTLLAHHLTTLLDTPLPAASAAWYRKSTPTFSDALAFVRSYLYCHLKETNSPFSTPSPLFPPSTPSALLLPLPFLSGFG